MSDLVLITGVTGHVGYATLVKTLEQGYTVRAVVRRESAINKLTSEPALQPYLTHLTFVIIPDLVAAGAFEDALVSVTHVIHIASPLAKPGADPERDIINPAVLITTNLLQCTLKSPSIRKIVITASLAAVRPSDMKPTDVIDPNAVVTEPTGPYNDFLSAYVASKVKAHLAVIEFVAQHKPAFSVVNIMPSFIIGPNPLAKTPEQVFSGSNTVVLGLLLGIQRSPGSCQVVHIDDVAFVHAAALDDTITGVQNFGLALNGYDGGVDLNETTAIVRANFAREVDEGILTLGKPVDFLQSEFDTRRTEQVFNFKHKNLESMVMDLVAYYVKAVREQRSSNKV